MGRTATRSSLRDQRLGPASTGHQLRPQPWCIDIADVREALPPTPRHRHRNSRTIAASRAGGRHNGPVIARSLLARRLMGNHMPGRGALLLVLVLAGSTSGCANSSPRGSATGTFTLANDTTSTVSVRDCLAASCDSGATTTLAPARSETLPMSGQGPGSAASMLLITGYGSGPRCFLIPPNVLPKPLRLAVTDATPAQCAGWAPLPVPDLSASPPINPSSNG